MRMRSLRLFPRSNAAEKVVLRLLPVIEDRSFLPPALGIVETPPSPIRISLMLTICLFATAALAWSWYGHIDVLATARGEIEPLGHVKVIQPLDTGKVSSVEVSEGQSVKAGDILLRLDPREVEADLQGASRAETAARAEAIRRQTAIEMISAGCTSCTTLPAWTEDIPLPTRQREEEVLRGDLHEIQSTVANLTDQGSEKKAAIQEAVMSIAAQKRLLATLNERVSMRDLLVHMNVGSRASVIDATQSLQEAEAQLTSYSGKEELAKAALSSLQSEKERTIQGFLADQTRKMAEARRTAVQRASERDKAQARLDHMTLRAPVDGVVQNLAITTVGQVVTVGQQLLRVVPSHQQIEIQAYLSNEDIGFVKPGQEAIVKVDAFPFTRYGTLVARVARISHDAIPAAAANEALIDHSRTNDRSAQALRPSAKPMTDLVFGMVLDLDATGIAVNDQMIPLSPGMTVSVEIKTGSRRILDYAFSPLVEVASTAMHER